MNVRYDVLWFSMMDEIIGRIDELNTKEETDLEHGFTEDGWKEVHVYNE